MSLYYPTTPIPSRITAEEVQFSTLVSDFADGGEQRRDRWSQEKNIFTIEYEPLERIELEHLYNFYRLCKGRKKQFYFVNPIEIALGTLLPYDQVKVWVQLHEGQGIKVDDWNGYLFPTYTARFFEDSLSKEHFTVRLLKSGIKIFQVLPLNFTNNYGTLAGGYAWVQVYEGTVCPSFNGSTGYCSFGDAADLDVGTGDFSLAIAVNPNSLAASVPIASKKASTGASDSGWYLVGNTNGSINFYLAGGGTQKTLLSATGALVAGTWKIIMAVLDRDGNGQIYVNNVASGSAVALTGAGNGDNAIYAYLARLASSYGNINLRNLMFAKKVWDTAERTKIWDNWRTIFNI